MGQTTTNRFHTADFASLLASLLQIISSILAIIDYRFKDAKPFGDFSLLTLAIWGSGLASLIAVLLFVFRRNFPSIARRRWVMAIMVFSPLLFSLFLGISLGQLKNKIFVYPESMENLPFILLQSFGFEGDYEGWHHTDPENNVVREISIEFDEAASHKGAGYLRLRVNLPGIVKGETIKFEQSATVSLSNINTIPLTQAVTAYVRVEPNDQSIENKFFAELQITSQSEINNVFSTKARYQLSPGNWTPLALTRPSSIFTGDLTYHVPNNPNTITLMIWSEKPFTGTISIDNISFYFIERP